MNPLIHLKQTSLLFLIAYVVAWFALSPRVQAQSAAAPSTKVYPTGSFPLDVQNVQAALNVGGTVVLKATNAAGQPTAFNFGPPDPVNGGGVNLTANVAILGEKVGQYMTTINGGFVPFLGQVPVQTHIEGIDFETPLASAITLIASTGTEIVRNRINGVVGILLIFGFTDGDGIDLFGNNDPQNAITGRATIADNVIENLGADFANGVQLDEVAANTTISGNTVQFPEPKGVVQSIGLLAFRSHNRVAIVGNTVTMGPGGPDVFPASIFVGGHADASYLIKGNTVISDNANADGIDAVAFSFSGPTHGALIVGNHVVMHSLVPTSGGIDFVGAVDHSIISANTIEGTSGNAIQMLGLDATLIADSNRALGNDISRFSASVSDVFFGPFSSNNLFAGHCATYIDLGAGNRITCGTAVDFPASAAAAAARSGSKVNMPNLDVHQAFFEAIQGRMAK